MISPVEKDVLDDEVTVKLEDEVVGLVEADDRDKDIALETVVVVVELVVELLEADEDVGCTAQDD